MELTAVGLVKLISIGELKIVKEVFEKIYALVTLIANTEYRTHLLTLNLLVY